MTLAVIVAAVMRYWAVGTIMIDRIVVMPGTAGIVMGARIAVLFRNVRPVIVAMLVVRSLVVMILLGLLRDVLMARNVLTARPSVHLTAVVHRSLRDREVMQDISRDMPYIEPVGLRVAHHRGKATGIIPGAVERHRLRRRAAGVTK